MVSFNGRFLTFAVLAAVLYGVPAEAQNVGISGVVRDARGLPMSGAAVTVTNQATGASSSTTTFTDGRYAVSGLAAGLEPLRGCRACARPPPGQIEPTRQWGLKSS